MNDPSPPSLAARFFDQIELVEVIPIATRSRRTFISSADFLAADCSHRWLVEGIAVAGQPMIIGGGKKTLKSSLSVDLAISMAAGGSFLNRFPVPEALRVGVVNGESGRATLQETLRRVSSSKGIDPAALAGLFWCFALPKLDNAEDLEYLSDQITEHQLDVIILDPLYLALLAGNSGKQATNLYDMGSLLSAVSETCLTVGATPILVHHTTKAAGASTKAPELDALSFAGVQEFARQWMMIGRKCKFQPSSGRHDLWLNVGGSAGHSGTYSLWVEEGTLDSNFEGRRWDVSVLNAEEAAETSQADQRNAAADRYEQQEQRLLAAFEQFPDGETLTALRDASRLGSDTSATIDRLLTSGRLERARIPKRSGNSGTREYDGFRLTRSGG